MTITYKYFACCQDGYLNFFYRFTWHFIKEKNDLYWFSTDHIVNVVTVVIFHLFHWIKMSRVKMSVASKHWQTSGKKICQVYGDINLP